jgi:septal ring factor EnvC (AmiA/AmiB activator)
MRNVTTSPGATFAGYTTLYAQTCCNCGVLFAIPELMDDQRRRDHQNFWCPNGHSQHYTGETDEQKLRKVRDQLAREQASHDQTLASLSATKGVVTKQRKKLERVAKGVCPCCNRSFSDLKKHMQTKHPDYEGQPQ